MKRESYITWLFCIVLICFLNKGIAQDNELNQVSESSVIEVEKNQSLTISNYLRFNEDYSTFVKVLKESNVFPHVESGMEITVFAPANSAFAQMPTTVINQLFQKENQHKLKSIAEYHIVNSKLNLEEDLFKLNGSTNIVAMNGEIIQITVGAEDRLVIQDANNYPIDVMDKIVLSNGVIYRIDAVLLPQVDVKVAYN